MSGQRDEMAADRAPGHGGNSGLCSLDHFCGCETTGTKCVDLFEHPMSALVDWDSPRWGVVGFNVHESAWCADGKHDDGVSDQ